MQDFADMAEAHEWSLRRLREMAGRLTEQAYLRASAAAGEDDEAHARWMLVFDRMARGLRLSIALEARLARERRSDAREIAQEAAGEPGGRRGAPSEKAPSEGARACAYAAEPAESDCERDDDGLLEAAPLAERIGRLTSIIESSAAPELAPGPASHRPASPAPARAERRALALQRAARARRAARDVPPDEPWDVIGPLDLADADFANPGLTQEPPWRGAG